MTSEEVKNEIELKGEDISPNKDGGILKEILKQGEGDEHPLPNDKVIVHYVGTLLDGTKFDSSRDRNEHFEFDIGKGSVIKAWDIGVATMKRGEQCRLICKPEYAYGEQGSGDKIKPNSTLVFEIELFDFHGEDISDSKDKSIIRRTLKKGEGYQKPNDGASVEVILKGSHGGKVFDDRTITFTMGEGILQNIPHGVEQAIMKMTKSEHSRFQLKSKATEGIEKFGVEPHTPVEYEVTLVTFEKAKESWSMNDAEKLEQAEVLKKRATELFKDGHYRLACKKYETITEYLRDPKYEKEEDQKKADELKLSAHSNTAICHLKLNEYTECIQACDKVLELDANNEKSLFRRAQAQLSMSNFDEAIKDFEKVLSMNPSNAAAQQSIQTCRDKIKAYKVKERQMYASMFGQRSQS